MMAPFPLPPVHSFLLRGSNMKFQRGFTLIELSIVLVIIGLVAGGIIVGRSVLDNAEMRTITTELNIYTTAYKEFVEKYDIKNYSLHIFNDANIENGITNFSKTIDADLIGMCTHGRTGLAHFFNGSISEDLVNHTTKPIITFKI